ncbi:MAG: glycoside hydrolase family 16 protein [Treponema sp.]|jgi:beta-glucanase (GH16 family)|nr:glycoside hydrolase family 16 protein [Treponema sp.]
MNKQFLPVLLMAAGGLLFAKCITSSHSIYEVSIASVAEPMTLVLEDNFRWNMGYQGLLINSALLKGGKFTKGDQWQLDVTFTASRDLISKLRVGLVDATEAADWWRTLSYKDVDGMNDMYMVLTDGLEKGKRVRASIPFTIIDTPTSNAPNANLIVFYADDDDGTEGVPHSGTKGNITLRFTKFTLTKLSGESMDTHNDIKAKGFNYDENNLSYELVWSDEFNYVGPPDPNKWSYNTGGHGWGNNELQYYTDGANAHVDGKNLIITARKEAMDGREVTSARLHTANKGDWLYGKIEVRAKLPKGIGTWPAIWLLPTDWSYGGWDTSVSGEIDIMEHVGYEEDILYTSVHTDVFHQNASKRRNGMTEDFHVYSVEWLPDKIKFSFDGILHYVFDPNQLSRNPTYKQWPFDKRFFLLLNLAFGGNWGGYRGVDYNCLPAIFEIDYVRVYQSPLFAIYQQ